MRKTYLAAIFAILMAASTSVACNTPKPVDPSGNWQASATSGTQIVGGANSAVLTGTYNAAAVQIGVTSSGPSLPGGPSLPAGPSVSGGQVQTSGVSTGFSVNTPNTMSVYQGTTFAGGSISGVFH